MLTFYFFKSTIFLQIALKSNMLYSSRDLFFIFCLCHPPRASLFKWPAHGWAAGCLKLCGAVLQSVRGKALHRN